MKRLLILALLIFPATAFAQKKPEPIKIYVCAQKNENGFVEANTVDSVKDVKKVLSGKVFRLVESPEEASMTLVILGRYLGSQIIGSQTNVNKGLFGGLNATTTQIQSTWTYVFTQIEVNGKKAQDLYGYGKFWKDAARGISKYLDKWVKANANQLGK